MSDTKFLGLCIVAAAALLSAAIYLAAAAHRYEFQQSNPPGVKYVFDRQTGTLDIK
jgi:hypothetical protein